LRVYRYRSAYWDDRRFVLLVKDERVVTVQLYTRTAAEAEGSQKLRQLPKNELVKSMDEDGYGTSSFPGDPSECWFCMSDTGEALW